MTEAHDGTVGGLYLFLDWAGRTGEMNRATASALRGTASKVFELLEEGEQADVTALDADALLERWERLNRTNYSTGSLQTYKSRFRQAVAMYKAWVVNEPDWKSAGKATPSNVAKPASRPKSRTKASAADAPTPPPGEAEVTRMSGVRLVGYDLPLRPDLLVRLTLPIDLTSDDARRISAFVSSLSFASPAPASDGHGEGSVTTEGG